MNHNALKWAAIGAGAWLLYRYFTKPKVSENKDKVPYPMGEGTPEQEANRPWWQPKQY